MKGAGGTIPHFLGNLKVVDFPEGESYELLQPLTNFRHCQDGTPAEARIVFICRQLGSHSQQPSKDEFVMKIKVQVPGGPQNPNQTPESGPSTTTSAEIKALETFRKANSADAPHLVNFRLAAQGPDGLFPGGYLTFTVMTKMPGESLLSLHFWGMSAEEREEIVQKFLVALRSIYLLGIEPEDRALRNVLWEQSTRRCTIVDFELWRETANSIADETKELQRWALARKPPGRSWWDAWNTQAR